MDTIITEIETFCDAHGIAESTFGRLVAKDTNLVNQLRQGREPRRKTVARVRNFMASYGAEKAA